MNPEIVVSFASSINEPENKYVIRSSPNALIHLRTSRKMPLPDLYMTIIRKITTSLNVVFFMVRIHFRINFMVNMLIIKRMTSFFELEILSFEM